MCLEYYIIIIAAQLPQIVTPIHDLSSNFLEKIAAHLYKIISDTANVVFHLFVINIMLKSVYSCFL